MEHKMREYLQKEHGISEQELFGREMSSLKRNKILEDVFYAQTGYWLDPQGGLVHSKNKLDKFPNYQNFHHIRSLHHLSFDAKRTVRKRRKSIIKLKIQKVNRKFKARKHYRKSIREMNRQYSKKWDRKFDPELVKGEQKLKPSKVENRLEELRNLRQKQSQNRNLKR